MMWANRNLINAIAQGAAPQFSEGGFYRDPSSGRVDIFQNGNLNWIPNPDIANSLYGNAWNNAPNIPGLDSIWSGEGSLQVGAPQSQPVAPAPAFQRSGLSYSGATPVPVRTPGSDSGGWTNSLSTSSPYYLDPWNNYHLGTNLGSASFFPTITDERNGTAQLFYGFDSTPWVSQNVQPYTLNGQSGFVVPDSQIGNLAGNLSQSGRNNGQYAKKDSGLGGLLGPVLGIASIAFPELAPFAAGANVAQGIASGNIGQAIGGALGLPGVGNAVTGAIGSGLSDLGVPASILPYATRGVIGAGAGLLGGASPQQALLGGLASGAGLYAGNQVSQALGSGMNPVLARMLSGVAAGGVNAGIRGGNIGMGALTGGLNGASSGLGLGNAGGLLAGYLQQQRAMAMRQQLIQQAMRRRAQAGA